MPLFEEKDTDKNGWVTCEDAQEILKKEFPSMTDAQLEKFAKSFDTDNNNQVRYGEFIMFYGRLKGR